tara:strand:+ start:2999 stop:3946 length:948 start_codon:yes stop_codon:yes gene_type:complete
MEHRLLGNSGLKVPAVGLGCNNFGGRLDPKETALVLNECIEEGLNFFDTANVYGGGLSEDYMGKALKGKRHEVLIATKAGMSVGDGPNESGSSRKHLMQQIDVSLSRLQTDYIDLYQIHRHDPNTPVEETMRALDDLVAQGKVRYIGCSNYAAWQIAESNGVANNLNLQPFVTVQPEYSMMKRDVEKEISPAAAKLGLGILPYFPLASGFLTGKYKRGAGTPDGTRLAGNQQRADATLTSSNFDLLEKLEDFASQRGYSMVELAIAWLLANPSVSCVIAGATKPEQVKANAKAGDCQITVEEKAELDAILEEHGF